MKCEPNDTICETIKEIIGIENISFVSYSDYERFFGDFGRKKPWFKLRDRTFCIEKEKYAKLRELGYSFTVYCRVERTCNPRLESWDCDDKICFRVDYGDCDRLESECSLAVELVEKAERGPIIILPPDVEIMQAISKAFKKLKEKLRRAFIKLRGVEPIET